MPNRIELEKNIEKLKKDVSDIKSDIRDLQKFLLNLNFSEQRIKDNVELKKIELAINEIPN